MQRSVEMHFAALRRHGGDYGTDGLCCEGNEDARKL